MSPNRKDELVSSAELRLSTELPTVDSGDLADRALDRVAAARRGAAEAAPEVNLNRLPPIRATEGLIKRTLAVVTFARRQRRLGGEAASWRVVRRWAPIALAAGFAAVLFLVLGVPAPEGPDRPAPAAASEVSISVEAVRGRVDVVRDGESGRLVAGASLRPGDLVVTAGDAEAILGVGRRARLKVDPFSRLRFGTIGPQTPELEVLQGRVQGEIDGRDSGRSQLRFVVAQAGVGLNAGRLGVIRVSEDRCLLAAVSAAVLDTTNGRLALPVNHVVRLDPRSELLPTPWPSVVPLTLRQTEPVGVGLAAATVEGQTNPEVVLVINGVLVPLDREGRFVATLPISEETTVLEASARDVLGHNHVTRLPLVRARSRVDWQGEPG